MSAEWQTAIALCFFCKKMTRWRAMLIMEFAVLGVPAVYACLSSCQESVAMGMVGGIG